MIIKKIKKLLLIFSIVLTLTSCGKQVINCNADEIKLFSWSFNGEQGLSANLEFENDNAVLTIDNNDKHCTIGGLCIIGENSLLIADNSLQKDFLFDYKLSGTELTLFYDEKEINFKKS